jgi:hypothetical protein
VVNHLPLIILDDDTPKRPDTSYDDLWSAQAKRFHRLHLEQEKLKTLNAPLK